jgi:hypothetical protein
MTMIMRIALCFVLTGCSYSITMVHTQGEATDVVDEVQRTDADIKTNLSIPAI